MIERLGIVCYLLAGFWVCLCAYAGSTDVLGVAVVPAASGYVLAGKPWEKE